ncbi:hypothetical protein QJQ58_15650 [Paenibacillus dendritiformis]|uniref:hypothetical protein n=1 Tax=Paenibacillus dendritiformis TaxID=130049 RepID=UPI00248B2B95|nr:hypothetical protein [Paenibacillus dendritiformis]WGU92046.1 hypothetical protein QJQ58_15650 [Paenibacillus dendritiformis]
MKLTLAEVQNIDNTLNQFKRVKVLNDSFIEVGQIFRATSIQEFILDLQVVVRTLESEKNEAVKAKRLCEMYLYLVIKYFTDFDDIKNYNLESKQGVGKALEAIKILTDTEILEKVMSTIPESEFKKLSQAIVNTQTIADIFLDNKYFHEKQPL